MIRISAGSAALCGLKKLTTDVYPSTAYLMTGNKCLYDCAFCPQSKSSTAREDLLSRVTWPEFEWDQLKYGLAKGENNGLKRICLQDTKQTDGVEYTRELLTEITNTTYLPVCVSANVNTVNDVETLIHAGADKVGISIDVCDPTRYREIKGGSFEKRIALIEQAAAKFPKRISTHLIIGLGESEKQAIDLIDWLIKQGIIVALFAFTPVKGTKLADRSSPELGKYRIIQTAHFLLKHAFVSSKYFEFNKIGQLKDFGISQKTLKQFIKDGEAFRTTGCNDCNRPYYNEKPGGIMYNFPRTLTEKESVEAVKTVFSRLNQVKSN